MYTSLNNVKSFKADISLLLAAFVAFTSLNILNCIQFTESYLILRYNSHYNLKYCSSSLVRQQCNNKYMIQKHKAFLLLFMFNKPTSMKGKRIIKIM